MGDHQECVENSISRNNLVALFSAFCPKITARCKRSRELLAAIKEKVWNVYHAITTANSRGTSTTWMAQTIPLQPVKEKVLICVAKLRSSKRLLIILKHTGQVTHLIGLWIIKIAFYTPRYFHRDSDSAILYLRSMALIWNFHPYCTRISHKDSVVRHLLSEI